MRSLTPNYLFVGHRKNHIFFRTTVTELAMIRIVFHLTVAGNLSGITPNQFPSTCLRGKLDLPVDALLILIQKKSSSVLTVLKRVFHLKMFSLE